MSSHRCGAKAADAGGTGREEGGRAEDGGLEDGGLEDGGAEARGGEDVAGEEVAGAGVEGTGVSAAIDAPGACDSEPASARTGPRLIAASCCAIASAFADSLARSKP